MEENKKENIDILRVLKNYQLNEFPSLIKNFLIVSFWVLLIMGIFFAIDFIVFYALEYFNFTIDGKSDDLDNFIAKINDLAQYFFLGKFGLWGSIIFICLIVFAKFDENWFESYSLKLQVPVWTWRKIIFFSIFLLSIGFFLDFLPNYLLTYVCFTICGLVIKFTYDETFRKVAKRVYPDLKDNENLII